MEEVILYLRLRGLRERDEKASLSFSLLVERERERDREVGGTKGIQEKKRAEEFWPFANGTLPRFFLAYNANPSTLGPNNSVEPVRPTWKRDTYATLSLSPSSPFSQPPFAALPLFPASARSSCPLQFLRYAIWNLQVLGQGRRGLLGGNGKGGHYVIPEKYPEGYIGSM